MKLSFFPSHIWVKDPILREGYSYYTKKERVHAIACDLLKRIPSYVTCFAFVSPFLSGWKTRVNFALIGAGCFLFSGAVMGLGHLNQIRHEKEREEPYRKFIRYQEHFCYGISKLAYAIFHLLTFQITLHEMGHALAGLVLFQGKTPTIEVSYLNGSTRTYTNQLSTVGAKIGAQKSLLILSAAGILMETIYNLGMLFFAHYSKDSDYANDLYARVSLNVFSSVSYALTAIWQSAMANDFLSIKTLGKIHPIVSAVMMVAIPALFKLSLVMIDRLTEKWSIHGRIPQAKLVA
jgi:hypothetical protein